MKLSNNPYRSSKITLPYVTVHDYFTDQELEQIEFLSKTKPLNKAITVSQLDESNISDNQIRVSSNSFHAYSQENSWFFEKLNIAIESINNSFYGFELYGYKDYQYAEYDGSVSGRYGAHMDLIMTDAKPADLLDTRKLSLSIILSDPINDFTGGDFLIYEGANPTKIDAQKGSIIFFPSFMLHEVTPVISGIRKSIVVWVEGPKFK
jgi:PKHD-type hydroxylase